MLTYLLVKGLGSAHYPVLGGSNPPVSIGEHGKRLYARVVKEVRYITVID